MQDTQNIKILMINDEQTVRQYLAKRFIKEGFTVKTCCSYEEATESALNDDFDIAIIDLKTSTIDVREVQDRLKKIQKFIQFIIFTEKEEEKKDEDKKGKNMVIYFPKPIEYGSLVNTIKDIYNYKLKVQSR